MFYQMSWHIQAFGSCSYRAVIAVLICLPKLNIGYLHGCVNLSAFAIYPLVYDAISWHELP